MVKIFKMYKFRTMGLDADEKLEKILEDDKRKEEYKNIKN